MFTHLPVDTKRPGMQMRGVKRKRPSKQYGNINQQHFKEEERKEGGGSDHTAPVEISQENRRVKSKLKEERIPPPTPPSIALALSDMVMHIGDTGEGGHCTSMPQNILSPGPR